MIAVKKKRKRYTKVDGGLYDQECTHVIFDIEEYRQFLEEIQKVTKEIQIYSATNERLQNEKTELDRADLRRAIDDNEIEEKEEEYKKMTKRNNFLTECIKEIVLFQKKMQWIFFEHAWRKKSLIPPKSSDRYLVILSEQWLERNKRFANKTTWRTVIQTPYHAWDTYKEEVQSDFLESGILLSMECDEIDLNIDVDEREDRSGNVLYRIEVNQNAKNGYWDLDIYTTKSLYIPENYMKGNLRL